MTTAFGEGIDAQPANLRAAATAMRDALAATDLEPLRQGTIVLSGIGASWNALAPATQALRAAGRRAFAVPVADLQHEPGGLADAYVLVSQSGASAETAAVVERLGDAPTYAISANGSSPVARRARAWLPLGHGEDSILSTLGYTATLQALGMLCDAVLGRDRAADWDRLPDAVAGVLERGDADARELAERWAGVRSLDAIGDGAGVAAAGATALLAREGLRLPAAAQSTRSYLHGPFESAGEGVGLIAFGGERELALAAEAATYGAAATVVTRGEASAPKGVQRIALPPVLDLGAPILDVLPVQLAVRHRARELGLALEGLSRPQDDTKLAPARG
jgi:glutamine---fructose-6-phosphate transaminase (isomerizing)